MSDSSNSFFYLLKQDHRYPKEAYQFVFETLEYAQNVLELGHSTPSEPLPHEIDSHGAGEQIESESAHKHITGQDLCNAARQYAVLQYGALAKIVLESLGIRSTSDIGEIVYNMIKIGKMRKTSEDSREDFDDVYDFDSVFQEEYSIK